MTYPGLLQLSQQTGYFRLKTRADLLSKRSGGLYQFTGVGGYQITMIFQEFGRDRSNSRLHKRETGINRFPAFNSKSEAGSGLLLSTLAVQIRQIPRFHRSFLPELPLQLELHLPPGLLRDSEVHLLPGRFLPPDQIY